jgi:predicted RNA-binding Zn ribbon-like protein
VGSNDWPYWKKRHFLASAPSRKLSAGCGRGSSLGYRSYCREAFYRNLKSILEGWVPRQTDLDTLRRELTIARSHERIVYSSGAFIWLWEDHRHALDRMLWPVTRSAVDLLTSAELAKVRQCRWQSCGWMFLDTSRNRSRLWCDSRVCGNRVQATRN